MHYVNLSGTYNDHWTFYRFIVYTACLLYASNLCSNKSLQ
jgi:hypothetical protein